jgi:sulfite exporter TauE/SafE
MLASIHPLGERARRSRWGVTVTAYLLGSVAGGAGAGAALGATGATLYAFLPAAGTIRAWSVAVACLLAAALELGVGRLRLPTIRRQVDEDWLARYRGWVYGAGFGFQLGLGAVTIVTTAGVYLAWALALLSGSAGRGAAVGVAFGVARAVPVLAMARVQRPDQLRDLHRGFQRWAGAAARITAAAMAVVAAVAIGAASAASAGAAWPG